MYHENLKTNLLEEDADHHVQGLRNVAGFGTGLAAVEQREDCQLGMQDDEHAEGEGDKLG